MIHKVDVSIRSRRRKHTRCVKHLISNDSMFKLTALNHNDDYSEEGNAAVQAECHGC